MNGASNHWATSGVTTILTPTPTGFRVQVTYLPGPITPASATGWRWQVNWRATLLRHTYSFAGQHIALRQGAPDLQKDVRLSPLFR